LHPKVKKLLLQNRQFLLYCAIGVCGVSLDFGVYSLLLKSKLLDYQAANAVGYASGTLLSFLLNVRYNFRVTGKMAARLFSFFCVAFLGWLASAGMLHLLIADCGWNKYLAKAATLVVVVLLQYNLNRLVSFRKMAP
jgi:putative flippase GtrA